ncbi:hypothetical protein PHAVU_010G055300 [Phaseolus vulgaris]|uniref:ADP-ribosyl cyclase/cyclic ADP-ribose hydrolase n=1 Tax=Phaseolus vulgaris TaxID=3885 RepID=V7AQN3_PHAVU|nr:hypothetical protein PHAVU_010G055300g [Phaseolus vulgaris]ESW06526.1 hypothetical protein PHAVU_010G055300g [Phaseolus vulgaris]
MASNAIIQYTSSSSSLATHIYDLFVSFRGEDTRNTFTSFLFQALRTKGIIVFKDDEDLKKGESIAPELLQAIQALHHFLSMVSLCSLCFIYVLLVRSVKRLLLRARVCVVATATCVCATATCVVSFFRS